MLRKIFLTISVSIFFAAGVYAQGTSTSTTTAKTASTGDAVKKPAVFRATKDQIKQVQTILKEKKLYDGEASGTLNDPTRAGIKSFQKDNGLKSTGALNRATVEKFGVELTDKQKLIPVLASSFATPADEAKPAKPAKTTKTSTSSKSAIAATMATTTGDKPKKAAPFRATPDQIRAAQKMLKDKAMYSGEETGKLDPATREGLKKFKETSGMKVTGTLNAATLEKMGIPLTDKQKADAAAAAAAPKN